MTINERKQLSNYIKGLVRESLGEVDMPSWHNELYGINDEDYNDKDFEDNASDTDEMGSDETQMPSEELEKWVQDYAQKQADDVFERSGREAAVDKWREILDDFTENPEKYQRLYKSLAYEVNEVRNKQMDGEKNGGLNELRQLAESYAREAFANILEEKKKSTSKKGGKKSSKKKESKSKSSTKNKTILSKLNSKSLNSADYYYRLYGAKTKKAKAAARSLGYKKAKGEKNDNGDPYYFTSQELARLGSMLGDIRSTSKH